MKVQALILLIVLSTSFVFSANASLVKQDLFNPNDGLIVYDSTTNLEWLTPTFTKNRTYNDGFIQSLNSNYGFRYATASETLNMITANFPLLPSGSPGNADGYAEGTAFFNLFGIAENIVCVRSNVRSPCPRTQGMTATDGSAVGRKYAVGVITFSNPNGDNTGYLIDNAGGWPTDLAREQAGSWLVRASNIVSAHTPSTLILMLISFGLVLNMRRFRK